MNYTDSISKILLENPLGWLIIIVNVLIMICLLILFSSILLDFILFHRKEGVKRKVNSFVETGTMFAFYIIYCLIIKIGIGKYLIESMKIRIILLIAGTLLIILGTIVNIVGRWVLQSNWANQVTIYNKHTLVDKGVYSYVRHPLYVSIIWMLIGGTFVYSNYVALAAVLAVFVPMMIYRAKQEETLLCSSISGYSEYKQKVGMFLPKICKYGSL